MVEDLLQGLFVGGLYALIALGFTMVFKSSRILNLAYGEQILILSYFLHWLLVARGAPSWLGIVVVLVCGAGLGFLIERIAIRPLLGQPFLALLMMTLMMGFMFKGIAALRWGGESFWYPFTPKGVWGETVQIVPAYVYAFVAALLVFALLFCLFRYTRAGLAMRAVACDHGISQSLGIRVRRIYSLSWVISGAFAAVCAILVGMVWGITPISGDIALGKGLPVLLLGGMGSVVGALVGGLGIGLIESLGMGWWGPQYQDVIPWAIMLIILMIRPWGLFGEQRIERI
jgi:branched-chain amino acid transport system permease protein